MNTVIIYANQTLPVEKIDTKSGKLFVILKLAENVKFRSETGEEITEPVYHKVLAWNKVAEQILAEDKIGKFYKIVGELKTKSHTDKDTGKEYINREIHARYVEVLFNPGVDVPKSKQQADSEVPAA